MAKDLPRFVIRQPAKNGTFRYFWTLPSYYRKLGCTLHKQHETALGNDYDAACGADGKGGKALANRSLRR